MRKVEENIIKEVAKENGYAHLPFEQQKILAETVTLFGQSAHDFRRLVFESLNRIEKNLQKNQHKRGNEDEK